MPPTMTQAELEEAYEQSEEMKAEVERAEIELKVNTKAVALLTKESKRLENTIQDLSSELKDQSHSLMKLKVTLKEKEEATERNQDAILELEAMSAQAIPEEELQMELQASPARNEDDDVKEEDAPTALAGVVQINFEETLVDFFVPMKYTFGELFNDALRYFQVDQSLVGLEDEQARVWTSSGNVRKELALTEEAKRGKTPVVFLRYKDLQTVAEEEDLGEFKSSRLKSAVEVEEQIDEAALALIAEDNRRRAATRAELFSYLIFVVAFMSVIMAWRDTQQNYWMRNSLQVSLLEEDFPLEAAHFQKNYFDIANGEEFFQYLNLVFVDQIDWQEPRGAVVAEYNHIIGGIRLRQLRVGDGSCTVPAENAKFPELGCYAPYSAGLRTTKPFGPGGKWKASEGNPLAKSVQGKLATYASGGYQLDFRLEQHNFTQAMKELEAEGWIDQGTRVVFIEMLIYNLNVNLFQITQIIVEFSAGGLAYPWARFLPLKIQASAGFISGSISAIFQLIYYIYILIFTKKLFDEFKSSRNATDPPNIFNFFMSGWNIMDFCINMLSYIFVILMLIYQSDPQAQAFDMRAEQYVDMFPVAETAELITQINSIACLLIWFKLLKYFNLSSRFEIMSNTLINALPNIVTFLIMFFVVFVAYATMAMLLYGHALIHYSTFGRTMISLFLVTLGDFDYGELLDITREFTPVYFFSFIIIVFFVMLNMFIGIIAESYAAENAKPKVSLSSEMVAFVKGVHDNIRGTVSGVYNYVIEVAEKIKKEEEEFRRKMEALKQRAATGKDIVDMLIDCDEPSLAARVEILWELPIKKFDPDYTTPDKLSEYEMGGNSLKGLIEEIEVTGFEDGKQKFEIELEELTNLMRELKELIVQTKEQIKQEEKEAEAALEAEGEGDSEAKDGEVKEEANPLLETKE